jgi:hypothetical protein
MTKPTTPRQKLPAKRILCIGRWIRTPKPKRKPATK